MKKISQWPSATGVTADDILIMTNDPSGTPVTQKVTAAQLAAYILAASALKLTGDHSHQSTGQEGGKIDHGSAVDGLDDDDHTQYVLAIGARAISGPITIDDIDIRAPGTSNEFIGDNAGNLTLTGLANIAVGENALNAITTGANNVAIGVNALNLNTTRSRNIAIGDYALSFVNTVGSDNVAVGHEALKNAVTSNQVAIGAAALKAATSGDGNTAIGFHALTVLTTGIQNTAIGTNVLSNNNGNCNNGVGNSALAGCTSGYNNNAQGDAALMALTIGHDNAAMGDAALTELTEGNYNTACGPSSLNKITTGIGNIGIGFQAGNTGVAANYLTTGSYDIFIGYNAGLGSSTQRTKAIAIGYNATVDADNTCVIGGTGADAVDLVSYGKLYGQIILDTQPVPIGWGIDGASAPDTLETITSTNSVKVRKFAGDSTQDLFIPFQLPFDFTGTVFKFRVIFFITEAVAPSNQGVAFYLKGASLGDSDGLASALGAGVKSSITGRSDAQYDRLATAWSGDVTITNMAAGETAILNLYRKHDDTDDTYAQKVGVFAVEIKYQRQLVSS